ncbi:GNAT family N-acetyltransferase [Streptomonospora mangrovi]|uniref:GNAT family N-acetyltransferase n=1 Tax=Streptomonospora mangrovi TaxID=2883123 RepID=UPI002FD812C0
MRIEIRQTPWDDAAGARLRADQERETLERYGADLEAGAKPSSDSVALFLTAHHADTGEAIGCGALRRIDDTAFEIKRMYVVPQWRGRRIGGLLLHALEEAGRERGATVVRLETGPLQPEAIRLYERCGYREIPQFGPYVGAPASVCFERRLTAPAGTAPQGDTPVGSARADTAPAGSAPA